MAYQVYLKLNGNATDYSGNALTSTTNGISYSAGKIGTAAVFSSGSASYIKGNTAGTNSNFTYSGIICPTAFPSSQTIFGYGGNASNNYMISCYFTSTGTISTRILQQNVGYLTTITSTYTATLGKWINLVVTRNAANLYCYVNGNVVASSTSASTQALTNGDYNFGVDGAFTTSGNFNGLMQQQIIDTTIWSQQYAKTQYCTTAGIF